MVKREDLIAPKNYNIVEEIERYASKSEKLALRWESEEWRRKKYYISTVNKKCE